MVLKHFDMDRITGKWNALMDDVIRKGASIETMERLLKQAGGMIVARAALLIEEDASLREDIFYLEKFPNFD